MAERISYEEAESSSLLDVGVTDFDKLAIAVHGELDVFSVLDAIDEPEKTVELDIAHRPQIRERISLKAADEYFGDYMPSEQEWQQLQLADQVDARFARPIIQEPHAMPIAEVERATLQLLGLEMGVECEEFDTICPETMRLAQLFTAARCQMELC